jgi:enoyl-CoA hydratase/carnithine racemase
MTMSTEIGAVRPQHLSWHVQGRIGIITLKRPEKKNALTFESYRELADLFGRLERVRDIGALVLTGAGADFCSGGDVNEIIGKLVELRQKGRAEALLEFTQMTGQVVKAMRACPQPIIAAIDGVCVGAGALLAAASDLRLGTSRSRVGFVFVHVGLSGADMGACTLLPRIVGQGRASELLYTGRFMGCDEAERWGFYNRVVEPDQLQQEALALAHSLAEGPSLANATTKRSLHQEWNMGLDEAIDAEAVAQALCMNSDDFVNAYHAYRAKKASSIQNK